MSECELCGRKTEKLIKTSLEDAILNVCDDCASYGKRIFEAKKEWNEDPLGIASIDPSYASIIKLKRETLNLGRQELASRVGEKLSYIECIENGMGIDEKTARKIEKVLGIKLMDKRF